LTNFWCQVFSKSRLAVAVRWKQNRRFYFPEAHQQFHFVKKVLIWKSQYHQFVSVCPRVLWWCDNAKILEGSLFWLKEHFYGWKSSNFYVWTCLASVKSLVFFSDGSGSKFLTRVGLDQPFIVWVWIWKISPKNVKFFNFFLFGSESTRVEGGSASYLLRVKSKLGSGRVRAHLYYCSLVANHHLKLSISSVNLGSPYLKDLAPSVP